MFELIFYIVNSWFVFIVLHTEFVLQHLLIVISLALGLEVAEFLGLGASLKGARALASSLLLSCSRIVEVGPNLHMASLGH